jgi:hypothetical protein
METQNTIIQLLNEAGYCNKNTNKQKSVKNINLLLDAGILTIKFVHADKFNDPKDRSIAYWYKKEGLYDKCSAYAVTIFGKTYAGHFVSKSHYIYDLDIDVMMAHVAKIISVVKGKGDFISPSEFAKYGKCSCAKCSGRGILQEFSYYADGVCFECGGSGIDRHTLKRYISESVKLATK